MARMSCINALSRTSWILLIEGLLPTEVLKRRQVLKLILHSLWAAFILNLMFHNIVNGIKANNFMLINRMVYVLMPVMTSFAKSVAVLTNKKCFISLLKDLRSNIFNRHSEKQNEHIQFVDKISKIMLRYFTITMGLFLSVACLLPIITNVRILIPSPYNLGRYEILYKILHFFVILYMGLNAACFDLLYLSLMGLCIAQLNILQENLTYPLKSAYTLDSKIIDGNVEECLRHCVILHEMINKWVHIYNSECMVL